MTANSTGLCHCGCGGRTSVAKCTNRAKGWVKGQPLRWLRGHGGGQPPVRRGADNNRFNGGFSTWEGRTIVVCRDGGWMLYSRALMAAHVGRLLKPSEIVHHKNEDPTDDRIENLQIVTRAEHAALHRWKINMAKASQRKAAA